MGPSLWEPGGGLLPLVMEPPGRAPHRHAAAEWRGVAHTAGERQLKIILASRILALLQTVMSRSLAFTVAPRRRAPRVATPAPGVPTPRQGFINPNC